MSVYKRGNTWWIKVRDASGREIRKSTGSTRKDRAKDFERDFIENEKRRCAGLGGHTWNEAVVGWLEDSARNLKPESLRRYQTSLNALDPYFEGRFLADIKRADIAAYMSARYQVAKTAKRDLWCVSAIMQWALSRDWIEHNPVRALDTKKLADTAARTRYLTRHEYAALVAHSAEPLRSMIVFSVATGLRLTEQLTLTWDDISLTRREISVRITKNGAPRVIPLTNDAEIALPIRRIDTKFLWAHKDGSRYSKMTRGLAGAAHRAGIKDLRWHDLRRTCGSWMLQEGVSLEIVSKWLGHSAIGVTQRSYAFLRTADLHKAAQRMSEVG